LIFINYPLRNPENECILVLFFGGQRYPINENSDGKTKIPSDNHILTFGFVG
jgi:hypothetical protein